MNMLMTVTWFTIRDQMRQKSFCVLLGIAILFVLMVRGCYDADYTVNGQKVDGVTIAWQASKMVFHVIASGMFLMVCLLSMRIFTRDREDGSMALFLARPVTRWQYVIGRIVGTWILSSLFMLIVHTTIFLVAWVKTGGIIPGYLTASLVCTVNLLFVTIAVCLLTLFLPDVFAVIVMAGVLAAGFVSDGMYQVMQTSIVQSALPEHLSSSPSLWRLLYPKVSLLQQYAVTLIDKSAFAGMGPVHPVVNVLLYSAGCAVLCVAVFNRKEL
jgi:ABC-type transport system involved in multi-copper enzyme maturation permease subunit